MDVAFPPGHAPSVGLSGETSCNMAAFSNCKNGCKTNDYQLKLKEVGLDSDAYNLLKKQQHT